MEASLPFPREITPPAYGVRAFSLSKQHYLNAGNLMDMMMGVEGICRTGGFKGRLEDSAGPSQQDILDCVNIVKNTVERDAINPETQRHFFDPTLQVRGNIWPEKNVYSMTAASNEVTDSWRVKKLRTEFKNLVLEHDFLDSLGNEQSDLEKIYHASGVTGVLNEFFNQMVQRKKKILYAINIELEEDLRTTKDLAMSKMISYISHLPGGPCAGINCPAVFIGQEGCTFNPHIEDCAFQAVNQLIAGAPKLWFIIPPGFYSAFTRLIKKLGVEASERSCDYLLNHNSLFLDPRLVIQYGIPVYTVVQQAGDIVYLLPHTVHWGINLGLNLNQGTNIASASWAQSGMVAPGRCSCTSDDGEVDDSGVFDITPILREIGIDGQTIENYQEGRIVDVMDVCNILHPENASPYSTTIKMEHLLGDAYRNTEVGKRFEVSSVTPDQAGRTEMWGGYEDVIDLSESDVEEEEEEIEEVTRDTRVSCPACEQTYQGGNVKRLREHVEKKHGTHPNIADYRSELDRKFPPRNKSKRQDCPLCRTSVAGGKAQMTAHQSTSKCHKLRDN